MRFVCVIIFLVLLYLEGCNSSGSYINTEELRLSPKSLTLGGNTCTLSAEVWRNLMPPVDTQAHNGISASLKLILPGEFPVNDSISVTEIYFIHNDDVWQTKPQNVDIIPGSGVMEIHVSGGPQWETKSSVTAVIKLKYGGLSKLISSGETEIKAVY